MEYNEFVSIEEYGGFGAKGLTRVPREGNKPPRIAETPSGILNSVGLQNPGVEHFAKHIMPILAEYDTNVIANMSGNTIEEYCEMAEILSDTDVAIIEMNISCPNVKHGGLAFGTDPKVVNELTSAVKKHSKKPLVVKLSPNVTSITEIAKAAEAGGADGLSLGGSGVRDDHCHPLHPQSAGPRRLPDAHPAGDGKPAHPFQADLQPVSIEQVWAAL